MKKLILILLISIGMYSCMTEQKCAKQYPPKVIIKDSIINITTTVYKDSIIYYLIPGDTVYSTKDSLIYVTVDKETGLINSDTSSLTSTFATAYAWVLNSRLEQMIITNDSIYRFKLDSAVRITTDRLERYYNETKIEKVFVTKWYDKAARVISFLTISAVVIAMLLNILRVYTSPFKR